VRAVASIRDKGRHMDERSFEVTGPLWVWTPKPPARGTWYFLRVGGQIANEIRFLAFESPRGFGSVPVAATIGKTHWRTSLFRANEGGGYLLPIKADVRRREGIAEGDEILAQMVIL
jgi:Domain of unknown function (DUF1905)